VIVKRGDLALTATVNGSEADAERKRHELIARADAITSGRESRGYTLREWIAIYRRRPSRPWGPRERRIVRYQLRTLLGLRLEELTNRRIETWAAELDRKGYSPATICLAFWTLSTIVREAWRRGPQILAEMPFRRPRLPRTDRAPRYIPAQDEILRLLRTAAKIDRSPLRDLHLRVAIMVCAGLRQGEVAALDWHDIYHTDDKSRFWLKISRTVDAYGQIGPTKGRAARDVPIPTDLGLILLSRKRGEIGKRGPIDAMFPYPRKGIWYRRRRGIDKSTAERLFKAAKLPRGWRVHDLRHTYGTRMAELHGARAAQRGLGHSSIRTTESVYLQESLDSLPALEILEKNLTGQS